MIEENQIYVSQTEGTFRRVLGVIGDRVVYSRGGIQIESA